MRGDWKRKKGGKESKLRGRKETKGEGQGRTEKGYEGKRKGERGGRGDPTDHLCPMPLNPSDSTAL